MGVCRPKPCNSFSNRVERSEAQYLFFTSKVIRIVYDLLFECFLFDRHEAIGWLFIARRISLFLIDR